MWIELFTLKLSNDSGIFIEVTRHFSPKYQLPVFMQDTANNLLPKAYGGCELQDCKDEWNIISIIVKSFERLVFVIDVCNFRL